MLSHGQRVRSLLAGVSIVFLMLAVNQAQEPAGNNAADPVKAAVETTAVIPEANFGGTLAVTDPTFNRPTTCSAISAVGTAVHFDTFTFTVPSTGPIVLSLDFPDGGFISPNGTAGQGPDTFLALYGPGGFNPATPLANCVAVNDDIATATNRRSRISTNLAVTGTYTIVMTSFNNTPTTVTNDNALPWTYFVSVTGAAAPVVMAATDFLVADFNTGQIAVLDQNLAFKGYLAVSQPAPYGLDFFSNGNVVANIRNTNQVKVFNNTGTVVSSFTSNINVSSNSQDIKTASNGRIYLGEGTGNIFEFDQAGNKLRGFGNVGSNYTGVALTPGRRMWGNQFSPTVDVFDLTTGAGNNIAPIFSFALDNGQTSAQTMFYSGLTNTVLSTSNGGDVFERNANTGVFVRKFLMTSIPPGTYRAFAGVTRGPGGDVYVTAYLGTGGDGRIARFNGTTGAFISATDVTAFLNAPCNIIWGGNIGVTAAGVNISGRVLTADGRGVRNARVLLTNSHGETRTAVSTSLGYYSFDNVTAGETYLIAVESKLFVFATHALQVTDSLSDVDLVAEP